MESLINKNEIIKLIRTVAQVVGGGVVLFVGDNLGVNLDAGVLSGEILFPVAVGLWILLVDALAKFVHPGFEMLNVISKTPAYTDTTGPPVIL